MNWEMVQGKWMQMRGELKSRWSKLTDDDLGRLAGKREALSGLLVERYGIVKDEAERQIDEWLAKIDARVHRDRGAAKSH